VAFDVKPAIDELLPAEHDHFQAHNKDNVMYTRAAFSHLSETMPTKSLKIDSLDLDLENPRIKLATDQRDAMQKIISEQKVKLVNLAESIADRGFSPMDRCLILRSDRGNKFVVLEGNRRILCAKLLKNPSLIPTFSMPDAFRKRLEKAAQKFDSKTVEPVDCFEVADRAEGNDWIRRRHNGEDGGRGIVDWSAIAVSRFTGRDPALQALEFVLEHGNLSEEQVERINSAKFLSTLDRLLSTPTVRKTIGFDIDNGKLLTRLPANEAIKPLKRIVLDLSEKAINVNHVKTKEQQNAYVNNLRGSDRADLSKEAGSMVPLESITSKDFSAAHSPTPKRARLARSKPRTAVIPTNCKLKIDTPKIAGIYDELKSLQLARHKHAIAVLLRVFLELSVDEYLTTVAGVKLTAANPKNGHVAEKNLRTKVNETISDLVAKGATQKDFLGVTKGLSDTNHPFSIDTLHAYIHNRYFTPVDTHLIAAWDNAQHFFEMIWS
jgi:hypothetical protein